MVWILECSGGFFASLQNFGLVEVLGCFACSFAHLLLGQIGWTLGRHGLLFSAYVRIVRILTRLRIRVVTALTGTVVRLKTFEVHFLFFL